MFVFVFEGGSEAVSGGRRRSSIRFLFFPSATSRAFLDCNRAFSLYLP